MREIKFQVVTDKGDFICNEWLDGDGWKHDHYSPLVANGTFNHEELGDGFLHELIRRQSTGVKDKDGVEIWESDLLRINYPVNIADGIFEAENLVDQEIICQVVFNDKLACFDLFTIKKDEHLSAWSFCGDDNEEVTVIGNIYNNHELINKQE